ILEPHIEQTIQRAAGHEVVLVVHDTTEFEFSTHREGLGHLRHYDHGFLMHGALAVTADKHRRPLGVLATHTWTRTGEPLRKTRRHKTDEADSKESARWLKLVLAAEDLVEQRAELIHVMDREGDAFPLLAAMSEANLRFIVRMARNRIAREDEGEERE